MKKTKPQKSATEKNTKKKVGFVLHDLEIALPKYTPCLPV